MCMDSIDRAIVAELERDGRQTNVDLASRVGLTAGPCLRRVQRLEADGVIRGYRAVVDPAALGAGFEVLVQVTMDREDAATVAAFERGVAEIPEVRDAERLFGDPDYLLRVATADIEAFQRLRDEALATLPGVRRLTSTIVMKRVVQARPYSARSAGADRRGATRRGR